MVPPSNHGERQYRHWKDHPLREVPVLSVVIPAYNEAWRIVPTIGAIAAHCSTLGLPWELIVVDDGSSDETVSIVQGLGLANLRMLEAEKNAGKGSAVRRGILAARGELILFADADNSTPIEELDSLLARMEEGFDVVIGSRGARDGEESKRSFQRRFLSIGLRWIVRHLFGVRVADSQCGFKLFRRHAGRHLCSLQTLMGFSFDLELLYLAGKFGYRVAEESVQWIDAPGSKVDPQREVFRFVADLVRIRINGLRGVYAPSTDTSRPGPIVQPATYQGT